MAVRRRGPKPDAVAVRLQRAGPGLLDSQRAGSIRRLQQHGRCSPVRAVHVVPEASQREYFARSLRASGQPVWGQVGVEGVNLITKTDYIGYDPEVSNYGSQAITRNIDLGPYPPSRQFFFTIQAGF